MKKVVLSLLFVIFSLSVLSALDIPLTKSAYFPGETIQLEIPDVFTTNLQLSNMGIYSGNSVHKSPAESGILKSGDKYLYYAILPQNPGDYSIRIENAKYYQGTQELSDTIIKNFSIIATNESYISINPGFVYSSKNFSINLRAYNLPQEIEAEFLATEQKQTAKVPLNAYKTLFFSISGITSFTKSSITLGDYSIPVIISPINPIKIQNTSLTLDANLEELIGVSIAKIEAVLLADKDYEFELVITNKTDNIIKELSISTAAKEISLDTESISEFENTATITITINSAEDFSDEIIISDNKTEISIPVIVTLTKNQSKVNEEITPGDYFQTCAEQNGKVCTAGQTCGGTFRIIAGEKCCLASCNSEGGSSGWLWGILILLVLGAGGFFIYKKAKENPGMKITEIFSKKTESFKERMSPEIKEGPEMRRGLSKI